MNKTKYWKFRIYPENKSLYFLVNIYLTKKAMHAAIRLLGVSKKEVRRTLQAGVVPLDGKKLPICGMVFFHRKMLGVSTTSHEVAHAALTWARRTGLNLSKEEERFCAVTGELNRQLVNKCYDLNIYEEK